MGDYYEHEREAQEEAYREEVVDEALESISREGVWSYLFRFGDAIELRIKDCLGQGQELHGAGHHGPALVCACTAIEVTVRYYVFSPLLQGMFLYDEWADILAGRVVSARAADERSLLPTLLKAWGVDINEARLRSGDGLWQTLHERVLPARNRFIHRGDPVSAEESTLAIDTAEKLYEVADKVIRRASKRPRIDTSSEDARRMGLDNTWGRGSSRRSPFV